MIDEHHEHHGTQTYNPTHAEGDAGWSRSSKVTGRSLTYWIACPRGKYATTLRHEMCIPREEDYARRLTVRRLVFLKWFDIGGLRLYRAGHVYINKDKKVSNLLLYVIQRMVRAG